MSGFVQTRLRVFITPLYLLFLFLLLFSFAGCADSDAQAPTPATGNRDSTPSVSVPEASGVTVYTSELVSVDASNTPNGYIMIQYMGTNEKVKLQIRMPDSTECTYLITEYNEYGAYPLSGGDGAYTVTVLESVDAEEDLYAITFTQDFTVTLKDEFTPYLVPNRYVDFTPDSQAVMLGKELAEGCGADLDVITNIYNYVIENIAYDVEKAKNVSYGYTPDIDETLDTGKGICFDYAALMSAMLRSQRIPSKLEVGYVGETYHAWISCYVEEVGWVDHIIEFDGKNWSLMDPTLAANNEASDVQEYIGDGSKYIVKYTY